MRENKSVSGGKVKSPKVLWLVKYDNWQAFGESTPKSLGNCRKGLSYRYGRDLLGP